MSLQNHKIILEKFLSGNASEKEKEIIISWFSNIDKEEEIKKLSQYYWDNPNSDFQLPQSEASRILDKIHHLINLQDHGSRKLSISGKRYIQVFMRIAAMLFIPLLISVILLSTKKHIRPDSGVISEILCPPGIRTMFVLPDGSHGWLNSNSSIRFPLEFTGNTREVSITGEVYFEVESSHKHPFIVTSNNLQVRATGTKFNVFAYEGANAMEVTLVEGRVDILKNQDGVIKKLGTLSPGKIGIIDSSLTAYSQKEADLEKNTAWKDGKIIFRDDSFSEVVKKFSRWYNVDIVIKDKELEDFTYVGTFQDETLDEVLKLLVLTSPIKYIDLGRKIQKEGTFRKRTIELYLNKKY